MASRLSHHPELALQLDDLKLARDFLAVGFSGGQLIAAPGVG
jgi:hypothetical protein